MFECIEINFQREEKNSAQASPASLLGVMYGQTEDGVKQISSLVMVSAGTRPTVEPKLNKETSIVTDIGSVMVQKEVSSAQGCDWEFS